VSLDAYCDGARRGSHTTPGHCACAFAVFNLGKLVAQGGRYLGRGSNNHAEYHGLLDCLKWAESNSVKGLSIHSDSQLIVRQVSGEWQVKQEDLRPLRDLAYALLIRGGHTLSWVRGHNGNAGNELCDKLCNDILDKELHVKE
jgi:ribonuclease HI